jgi:uncharacterized protein with PIN domain
MKFYLDEDLSPKISGLLRKNGIDALSAHEVGMTGASDREQLEFATSQKRCLVTRNRDDFIHLSAQFFNDRLPHSGVIIVSHTVPGDRFSLMARLLTRFARHHSSGIESYLVSFLSVK